MNVQEFQVEMLKVQEVVSIRLIKEEGKLRILIRACRIRPVLGILRCLCRRWHEGLSSIS